MGQERPPAVMWTSYTSVHKDDGTLCAPDVAYQNGAVVINEKDQVLVFEHIESGMYSLPRLIEEESLEKLIRSPLQFIHDKTGLFVERLPLVKPVRKYKRPDAEAWHDVEPQLCFENATTTSPFLVALDLAWFRIRERPENLDGRQSFVNWYSGIVRGNQEGTRESKDSIFRVHFMSIEDSLATIVDDDYVARPALLLFDVLWNATKRLHPTTN